MDDYQKNSEKQQTLHRSSRKVSFHSVTLYNSHSRRIGIIERSCISEFINILVYFPVSAYITILDLNLKGENNEFSEFFQI